MARRFVMHIRRPRFRGTSTPVVTVGHSTRRLVALTLGSAVLFVLVYLAAVQTTLGQAFEDLVLWGRPTGSADAVDLAWRALGTLNLTVAAVATVGLVGVAVALGRPFLAMGVVVAIAGANLTTQWLKDEVLDRPNLVGDAAYAYGNSFPSGHVTLAASLALAALLVAPRRLRSLVALAGAAYVGVVGISTLTAGWHRLADALGAILVALAWTSLVAAILAATRGSMPRRTWRAGAGGFGTSLLLAGALALFVVALALLAYAWVTGALAEGPLVVTPEAPLAFILAVSILGAGALLASASLLWALRGVTLESRGVASDPAG